MALPVNAKGLDGYNAVWGKKSDTFTVNVTGSKKATGYVTIRARKASNKGSSGDWVQYNIQRPDKTWVFFSPQTVFMNGNEWKASFKNAPKGKYTVSFTNLNAPSPVDFLCWIYG
jgi:hypothetical protein